VVTEVGLEATSTTKNDTESTDVQVMISLPKTTLLRPGYNVDLEITTKRDDKAVAVPYEAIIDKKGAPYIFVVHNKVARLKKVVTGISDNLTIQIKKGLNPGDKVVISPPKDLKDGVKVEVQ
jgi:HlyD family secretion protein